MMYCTKCGSDLKGSKQRCPVCGYSVMKMKDDLSKSQPRGGGGDTIGKGSFAPPYPTSAEEGPSEWEEGDVEEGPEDAEEDYEDPTLVDGCFLCGATPRRRCFFCLSPVCDRHTEKLQIYVRNMPFGSHVDACSRCSSEKEGRNPTKAEAEEAGMFFAIKPYHEWRRVRK